MAKHTRGIDLLKAKTTKALKAEVTKSKSLEEELQKRVVQYVNDMKVAGLEFWHTPNGGKRGIRTAVKLKAAGTLAGVSDLIFSLPDGRMIFLELKSPVYKKPYKELSPSQVHFLEAMERRGHETNCMNNFDLIIKWLESRSVVRPNVSLRVAA